MKIHLREYVQKPVILGSTGLVFDMLLPADNRTIIHFHQNGLSRKYNVHFHRPFTSSINCNHP